MQNKDCVDKINHDLTLKNNNYTSLKYCLLEFIIMTYLSLQYTNRRQRGDNYSRYHRPCNNYSDYRYGFYLE